MDLANGDSGGSVVSFDSLLSRADDEALDGRPLSVRDDDFTQGSTRTSWLGMMVLTGNGTLQGL